jgi:hypothetical protein
VFVYETTHVLIFSSYYNSSMEYKLIMNKEYDNNIILLLPLGHIPFTFFSFTKKETPLFVIILLSYFVHHLTIPHGLTCLFYLGVTSVLTIHSILVRTKMLDHSPIVSLALHQRKIIGLFVASFIQENTTVQNILF